MTNPPRSLSEQEWAGDTFKTTEMALAGYLSMSGLAFTISESDMDGKFFFVFEPETRDERDDLEVLIERFNTGSARVEPRRFMNGLTIVRRQLFAFRDGVLEKLEEG